MSDKYTPSHWSDRRPVVSSVADDISAKILDDLANSSWAVKHPAALADLRRDLRWDIAGSIDKVLVDAKVRDLP